jgi:6-phospho-beta-glucosidase
MHTITVLGGSSISSPDLVAAVAAAQLGPIRVVLHGRSKEKLDLVAAVCRGTAGESAVTVEATTDLRAAVQTADIILNQVRVGGYRARTFDETFPLAFDIPGEETMGPGGVANSLRTVPVVLEMSRTITEVAPRAWFVNLTNPSSVIQYALTRYTPLRTIGVCDSPVTLVRGIAGLLAADPGAVRVDYVGMHHFGWITRVWCNGSDVTREVLLRVDALPGLAVDPELVRAIGAIPHPYLNYVLAPKTMLEKRRGRRARAEELLNLEAEILDEYRRYVRERLRGYPDVLRARRAVWYDLIIVPVIAGLLGVRPAVHIVNVPNGTTVPWLPPDAVVEVPCIVDRAGPHPQAPGPAPRDVVALTQTNCAYEQLLVEAIVERSYEKAWRAMTLNLLVRDAATARRILDLIWPDGSPREEQHH